MKIKKFFMFPGITGWSVVEMPDGSFAKFIDAPFRKISEQDLTPVPYYQPIGHRAEEMPDYMYRLYGLTK